jgi:hypothetical protein
MNLPNYKSEKGMLDMKIGCWNGKMKANPKFKDLAEKEIAKLKLEKIELNKNKSFS